MRNDEDPGLPIKLGPCSNAEYDPEPELPLVLRETVRRATDACERNARRLGMSRREFLLSICGAATTLALLDSCSREAYLADPFRATSGPGGRYLIPPEATVDVRARARSHRRRGVRVRHPGTPARVRPQPHPERPGLLDAVPAAELRRGRPPRLLLDRQLHGADVPAIRHVEAGAVRAPHLSARQSAVAQDHERDAPDRRGPLPRRARAAPRTGAAERGTAPGGARRDGTYGAPVSDRRVEDVHAFPGRVRGQRQRVVARRSRSVAAAGRRALHPEGPRPRVSRRSARTRGSAAEARTRRPSTWDPPRAGIPT